MGNTILSKPMYFNGYGYFSDPRMRDHLTGVGAVSFCCRNDYFGFKNCTGDGSFSAGYGNAALGICSVALGANTTASQSQSFAMGNSVSATGAYSISLGLGGNYNGQQRGISSGVSSVCIGEYCNASGYNSKAIGYDCVASNIGAIAIGRSLITYDDYSFVTGCGNTRATNTHQYFAVGNGTPLQSGRRHNIFEIRYNSTMQSVELVLNDTSITEPQLAALVRLVTNMSMASSNPDQLTIDDIPVKSSSIAPSMVSTVSIDVSEETDAIKFPAPEDIAEQAESEIRTD